MFSKLISKLTSSKNERQPKPIMVMVALANSDLPATELLFDLFNRICENAGDVKNIERNEDIIIFEYDGEIGYIALMEAPFPWSDLEGPCATAWHWPEATEKMRQQTAHILISLISKKTDIDMIARTKLFTQLTASVAEATDAIGVYWGSGTVVQSRDVFVNQAKKMDSGSLPVMLWTEFRLQKRPDGSFDLITTGMEALGLMEIEILGSKKTPLELVDFVHNIASYLLINGPVIRDGDTVGEDENQRITVKFMSSVWKRPGKVMMINF
ncbi:MAG: DUF4261 domain-containing protein [Acidobacteriota bacterium]